MFEQLSKIEHSSIELAKARSLLTRIVEDYADDPAVDDNFTNIMYILLDMISNSREEIAEGFQQLHKMLKESDMVPVAGGAVNG